MSLAVPVPESINEASPSRPSAELLANLEHMGILDALEGFIVPERVRRWGFLEVEAFARQHGYQFVREHGNIYGRLMLVPLEPVSVPALRVITRSDHAAAVPSRKR